MTDGPVLSDAQAAKLRTFADGRMQLVRDTWDAPEIDALLRAGLLEIKQIAKASMTFGLTAAGEAWLEQNPPA